MILLHLSAAFPPAGLLAQATTAASAPATTAASAPASSGDFWSSLFAGVLVAWLVAAVAILIGIGFFRGKPLRSQADGGKAPDRKAIGLLPLAFATVILYFLGVVVALVFGEATHFVHLPDKSEAATQPAITLPPPMTLNATTSAPATEPATATASKPADADPDDDVHETPAQLTDELHMQLLDTGAELAAVAFAVFICHKLFKNGLTGMGLHPKFLPWGIVLGLFGYFLFFPIFNLLEVVVELIYNALHHNITVHDTIQKIRESPQQLQFAFALLAGVAAPIAEEIFFRGILQSALIQEQWGMNLPFGRRLPPNPPPAFPVTFPATTPLNYAVPSLAPARDMPLPRWLALGGALLTYAIVVYLIPGSLFFITGVIFCAILGFIFTFIPSRPYALTPDRRWLAIIMTSIAFISVHANVDHAPLLLLLSITLGYIYERTGNLFACITIHACFNWTSLILTMISKNG